MCPSLAMHRARTPNISIFFHGRQRLDPLCSDSFALLGMTDVDCNGLQWKRIEAAWI